MNEKEKIIIALTGHRPSKLAGYDLNKLYYQKMQKELEKIIESFLQNHKIVECHSGMALGADTVWAQAICTLKEKHPNQIVFIADIPDTNQCSKWSQEDQKRWQRLLEKTNTIKTYADKHKNRSYAYILNQRNFGMVDACDVLIAIYDGHSKGGTLNTILAAQRASKKIIQIQP